MAARGEAPYVAPARGPAYDCARGLRALRRALHLALPLVRLAVRGELRLGGIRCVLSAARSLDRLQSALLACDKRREIRQTPYLGNRSRHSRACTSCKDAGRTSAVCQPAGKGVAVGVIELCAGRTSAAASLAFRPGFSAISRLNSSTISACSRAF
jgi:hypothetical protein